MSNVEANPAELVCADRPSSRGVTVLTPRDVPLGGPRALRVRRTLPQRQRSLIGAWCFADHYGPEDVAVSGGMDVAPHPHTGLQTASWLFSGVIEHRDSLGTHGLVRPGELNLMTGGHGIAHSEVSTPDTTILHGVQLWIALPDEHRHTGRDFRHYAPPLVTLPGAAVRVFLGSLAGSTSPVPAFTPLLGAELTLDPGARVSLDADPAFEHGVLQDTGSVTVEGTALGNGELAYLAPGADHLELANDGDGPARVLLLGGTPFAEEILMWWNFVGRSHDEIAAYREAWQAQSDQFGQVEGYTGRVSRLPAPELPHTRIKPRRNPSH
ncbi:pirin family protein [Amycolatopsis thermophila]|uniref:Redox-sensitive bicupin YhaK (Pirin superfamily) n=1 Tax=Amycolatopsis thermophila TaxID=206084 RepID=A0ABU0F0I0_9PSEU|nr:pirin family protein [Amycolatopsis thermophila]MDQ0380998.1 redox-sensitive bicupin YhaK (pirin superfamily) [Amycolatopsis thermophila]